MPHRVSPRSRTRPGVPAPPTCPPARPAPPRSVRRSGPSRPDHRGGGIPLPPTLPLPGGGVAALAAALAIGGALAADRATPLACAVALLCAASILTPRRRAPVGPAGAAVVSLDAALADMRALPQEQLRVLLLDRRGRVAGVHLVYQGTSDAVPALEARDVFREAIRREAVALTLAHNHPGGDGWPSDSDIEATARIATAGALLGIPLSDHLILFPGGTTSFRDLALLP